LSHDLILTVNATSPTGEAAPFFTLQPYPKAAAEAGTSLTLSAEAVGTPAPTYQWRKNGSAISGATTSILTFASLTINDSGTYSVVATNSAGTATSNDSFLAVMSPATANAPAEVAPVITLQPVSQVAQLKSTVSFTVATSGTPAPTFQWYKDGHPIHGATSATYTISAINFSHNGSYVAVATNSAGTATSEPAHFKYYR
jgi:hypothetical protein